MSSKVVTQEDLKNIFESLGEGSYGTRIDTLEDLPHVVSMSSSEVSTGGSGIWRYRIWSNGWQEAWYQGSITFSSAAVSTNGWYRSVQNFNLPISFADDSTIIVTGSYAGKVYTSGGIKTSGTQFEAQILGGSTLAARTNTGWSVYVSGMPRS